jgi:hypothetical protein
MAMPPCQVQKASSSAGRGLLHRISPSPLPLPVTRDRKRISAPGITFNFKTDLTDAESDGRQQRVIHMTSVHPITAMLEADFFQEFLQERLL